MEEDVFVFISDFRVSDLNELHITKIKKYGYKILVVTNNEKYTSSQVDYVIFTDLFNVNKLLMDIIEFSNEHNIVGFLTFSEDMVENTAFVSTYFGLPSPSVNTVKSCRNKYLSRKRQEEANIKVPKYALVKSIDDINNNVSRLGFPMIIKPVDGLGSMFTDKIENIDEIKIKFKMVDKRKKVSKFNASLMTEEYWALEEFVEGFQISVESFTYEGKTQIICIHDKMNNIEPPYFLVHLSVTPSPRISSELKKEIEEITIRALRAVAFDNGVSHTEFKITKNGPILIEINCRPGGGLIVESAYYSTGINIFEVAVDIALGKEPTLMSLLQPQNPVAFRVLYSKSNGYVKKYKINEEYDDSRIKIIRYLKNESDYLTIYDYAGYVLVAGNENEDLEDVINLVNNVSSTIDIEVII